MLGGSTVQFFSIIPVVIMVTWLGRRDGTIASLLFIPKPWSAHDLATRIDWALASKWGK
jgi:hypothetical protein